jgi:hypothetical protein
MTNTCSTKYLDVLRRTSLSKRYFFTNAEAEANHMSSHISVHQRKVMSIICVNLCSIFASNEDKRRRCNIYSEGSNPVSKGCNCVREKNAHPTRIALCTGASWGVPQQACYQLVFSSVSLADFTIGKLKRYRGSHEAMEVSAQLLRRMISFVCSLL